MRSGSAEAYELDAIGKSENPERVFHSGLAHQPVKLITIIGSRQSEVKVTEESACRRLLVRFPTKPGNAVDPTGFEPAPSRLTG
jgi:hypothetical protein